MSIIILSWLKKIAAQLLQSHPKSHFSEFFTFIGNYINVPVDVITASRTDRDKFKKDIANKLELTE